MHEPLGALPRRAVDRPRPCRSLFVWDRLRELKERGVTLLLTTHDMDEAAELADRVAIIDHGKLLAYRYARRARARAAGRHDTRPEHGSRSTDSRSTSSYERLAALRGVESVESNTESGGLHLRLYVSGEAHLLVGPAAALLTERGLELADVTVGNATLEDVFISLTGRALR